MEAEIFSLLSRRACSNTGNHRLTVHLELNTVVCVVFLVLILAPCVVPSCDVSSLALPCKNKMAESSSQFC